MSQNPKKENSAKKSKRIYLLLIPVLLVIGVLIYYYTSSDKYIVVLDDGINPNQTAEEMKNEYGIVPDFIYDTALNGFSAKIPMRVLKKIKEDKRVDYIEKDKEVSVSTL